MRRFRWVLVTVELCELPMVLIRPGALAEGKVASDAGMTQHSVILGGPTLAYVRRGQGRMRTAEGEFPVAPGTLVSVAAGPIACEVGDEHELVVVAMRAADGGRSSFAPPFARRLAPDAADAWHARLLRMVALSDEGRVGEADVAAIWRDLEPLMWLRGGTYARDTLREVFRIVWERAAEPLSLAGIAGAVGYTPNYLTDLSREHTGRSLGKWIADIRMTRARHELETTNLPIAEIGAACGYDDPAYFSRAFRRMHGVPPATWRAAHHGEICTCPVAPVIVSEAAQSAA